MMFIFNLLKRNDRPLGILAFIIGAGLFVLLAGLWFVQIAFASHYQDNLKRQSFRAVAIPAVRGLILDRNGQALAENRPRYNAVVYLEDLQRQFDMTYDGLAADYKERLPASVRRMRHFALAPSIRQRLELNADCDVVQSISARVKSALGAPETFDTNKFLRHRDEYPYVPYQILPDLAPRQVAIFEEQFSGQSSLELETQPIRFYPYGSLAAHLLGFVQRKDPEASFRYSLPTYVGRSGLEKMFDDELCGQTGVKSVLVNNLSYRQSEEIDSPAEPGNDLYLTIDLDVQRAAEAALAKAPVQHCRGAVIVMDVRNGDVLAIASSPTFDPNEYITGVSPEERARLFDPILSPQLNRAIGGAFAPGSTFKIVTAIACLENGLDPNEVFDSPGEYRVPGYHHVIGDTAGPGKFDFKRAFYKSSNTYFINYGMKAGLRHILEVAKRFHLGEKTDMGPQEIAGFVPAPGEMAQAELYHSLPDVCIGQEITVTPTQMACLTAAVANGGTLFWPRVVDKLRDIDTDTFEPLVPQGRVRDTVKINPAHLNIIREAMAMDTQANDPSLGKGGEGTAYLAFHNSHTGQPILGDFHVAGKTGSAEVKGPDHRPYKTTWFVSYGPYESPRYAVVVMVDHGDFGGTTCAPVACAIYKALIKMEQTHGHEGAPRRPPLVATISHD